MTICSNDPGVDDMIERLKKGASDSISSPFFSSLLSLMLSHGHIEDLEFALRLYQDAREKADENVMLVVLETLGRVQKSELVERVLQLPLSVATKDQDVGIKSPRRAITLTRNLNRSVLFLNTCRTVQLAFLAFGGGLSRFGKC
jgi:hypothetical protein